MKRDKESIEFQRVYVDVEEYFLELIDDLYIQALARMPEDPNAKSYNAEEIGDLFDEIKGV
ncbi:MAG: hypothetical protein PF487_07525 [Bacteroidales bacterium]|jgi:hypothetical protein|nr:hypothetical protein [Bacteroidales bacterium]